MVLLMVIYSLYLLGVLASPREVPTSACLCSGFKQNKDFRIKSKCLSHTIETLTAERTMTKHYRKQVLSIVYHVKFRRQNLSK